MALRYTVLMVDRRLFLSFYLLGIFLLIFLAFRYFSSAQAFGPAIAICPGPDLYGYTCENGRFAYIDATNDTFLYADDATISLPLPFPFTFYGTTYTEVKASTNGNLQFTTDNPSFDNLCLTPANGIGDAIVPYWDDLDVRFAGFLETEVVGEAPDRIFVVEWDNVPPFGADLADGITFEIQLHESTNDIIFWYEDVTTFVEGNGRSATIGTQSEAQGIALQYSCNQPTLADATQITWLHPQNPNRSVGLTAPSMQTLPVHTVQAKGETARFLDALNARGRAALVQWQQHWRSQTPPLTVAWEEVDVTGNGRVELILLQQAPETHPQYSQLLVLAQENGRYTLLWQTPLADRTNPGMQYTLLDTPDLTGDGTAELLLQDGRTHQFLVITNHNTTLQKIPLPETCTGSYTLHDINHDNQTDITREKCPSAPRLTVTWNGTTFQPITP
ncbi:MAG: hypothetical protein Kow0080_14630 [Candidatus Promineifilaceae bacterium]